MLVNVWLLNCFSAVPLRESPEQRTAALASELRRRGCRVTWFTSDWNHQSKTRLCEPGTYVLTAALPYLDPRSPRASPLDDGAEGDHGRDPALLLEVVAAPPYSRNVSLRRLYSHLAWGHRVWKRAVALVTEGGLAVPDLIIASSPPLEAASVGRRLAERFNSAFAIDLTDLWPHAFAAILGRSSIARVIGAPAVAILERGVARDWRLASGVSAVSCEYLDVVAKTAPRQRLHRCYIGGYATPADEIEVGATVHRSPESPSCDSTAVPSGPTVTNFLYVGLLSDSYDLATLVEACAVLAAEHLPFTVTVAGDGPLRTVLERRVVEAGLAKHVGFVGRLPPAALGDLLKKSDVGLNVIGRGRWITMPNKLSDYLCSGLAVINSLSGEAERLLTEHHAGLTYEAGDPRSLTDAMRRFINEQDLLDASKANALSLASLHFHRPNTYAAWASWLLALPRRRLHERDTDNR